MARARRALVEAASGKPAAHIRAVTATPPLAGRDPGETDARHRSVLQLSGLQALSVEAFDEAARIVTLVVGRDVVEAALDPALDPRVVKTALARGERLIAQHDGQGWVALGALRTAPTPGVDEGDEFTIKARRVDIVAEHELSVRAGAASLVLRAYGYVETVAEDITTRAVGVHKIIGRMIRLN